MYELPNLTAYNETCAAQANILWNHRLFLPTGAAKYIDILERTLYNGFLAGVGMDGESFFYVNPLSCDGQYQFNRWSHLTRQPWNNCSCCPTNVVRLLPSLSRYIYAVEGDTRYVNLYMTNSAVVDVNKTAVKLSQVTNYPWDGNIKLKIETASQSKFELRLRVPGWALNQPVPSQLYSYIDEPDKDGITIKVNGEPVEAVVANGFVVIDQAWAEVSDIEIDFPMKIRRVIADKQANDLTNKVALERGPIVYALEEIDNAINVFDLALNDETKLAVEHRPTVLNGLAAITGVVDSVSLIRETHLLRFPITLGGIVARAK